MVIWPPLRKCRFRNRMEKNEIILLVCLRGPDISCHGGGSTGRRSSACGAEHHAAGSRAACFAPQSRSAHRGISGGGEAARQGRGQKLVFSNGSERQARQDCNRLTIRRNSRGQP